MDKFGRWDDFLLGGNEGTSGGGIFWKLLLRTHHYVAWLEKTYSTGVNRE